MSGHASKRSLAASSDMGGEGDDEDDEMVHTLALTPFFAHKLPDCFLRSYLLLASILPARSDFFFHSLTTLVTYGRLCTTDHWAGAADDAGPYGEF
jgi:hypothetical protein